MATETKDIYKIIPKIMKLVGVVGKDRTNDMQHYKFRGIDDMYNALNKHLASEGVFATTKVMDTKREERPSRNGGVLLYTLLIVEFEFFAGDGSSVKSVTVGEAMDSGDKSANKAMSTAYKYALMQLFCIPTDEDKDTETTTHEIVAKPVTPKTTVAPQPKIMFIPAKIEERKALLAAAQVTNPDWTAVKLGKYVVTTFKLTSSAQFSHAQCEALLKKFQQKAKEQGDKMEQDLKDAVPEEEITAEMVDEGVNPAISGPVLDTDSKLVKDLKMKNNVKNIGAK